MKLPRFGVLRKFMSEILQILKTTEKNDGANLPFRPLEITLL